MTRFVLFLMLIWLVLTGEFTLENVILAGILGGGALWFTMRGNTYVWQMPSLTRSLYRLVRLVELTIFFIIQIFLANLRLTITVLSPRMGLKPGIVSVPIDGATPTEITVLANMITLTPGTLSLEISPDKAILFVHAMHVTDADAFRKDIQDNFYRRVREVFR
jgi:multicomponent Na+:H+ antiporter subunit E